jgi:predicted RNase H-like HicB family nuclease
MYRVWYWAMIDRESDGRVVASVPDLDDVAVSASTEKDALAHLTGLAAERVRAAFYRVAKPLPEQGDRSRHHSGRSGAHRCLAGTAFRDVAVGVELD